MINIFICGDIFIKSKRGHLVDSKLQSIIRNNDIAICNFEGPIPGNGSPILKAGPHLSQALFAPKLVIDSGFNVINMANNHAYDYGELGLQETKNAFSPFPVIGIGTYQDAYSIFVREIRGVKIGVLALCENQFGSLNQATFTENETGYAWINHACVNSIVKQAHEYIDVLIILAHAGAEDVDHPIPEWRERYKELITAGADIIVGSHPHIIQGMEFFKDKPIYYSLGNFVFDVEQVMKPSWRDSLCLQIQIDQKTKRIDKIEHLFTADNGTSVTCATNTDYLASRLLSLQAIISSDEYIHTANTQAVELWHERYLPLHLQTIKYPNCIKQFIHRISRKQIQSSLRKPELLLHNLQIETHRWTIERALRQTLNLQSRKTHE